MSDWREAKDRWEKEVYNPAKYQERKCGFDAVYTPDAAPENSYLSQLGFPGQYPFTRGVQPTLYRGKYWTMRQYSGFGSAHDTNERYHYLLGSGQTGLSVAFDLPTQMGRDADHPRAQGEVGKVGVSIGSIHDMQTLFRGIPLGTVSTSMTINATASILLCLYAAVAEQSGTPMAALSGTIQNDILKEYIARGTYIYPAAPSLRLITDVIAFCAQKIPKWNPISISGYHIREAGSTAAQEIAFTLGNGIAYVEAALKVGLELDAFAGRLSFFFNVHNHFLEEVAKFRAARRLWARIMKERFKSQAARSMMLRFHAQTAGSTLTAQQPDNNVVRVSLQALAAVLGGCQSLHTNSRDEALALPSEASARLALRTQKIIAYESGVADTVDPLGGAYAIEHLTDQLESEAQVYLDKIESMGGMVAAIENGFPQREIQDAAFAAQKSLEDKTTLVVGVNAFQVSEPPPTGLLKVNEEVEKLQADQLKTLKTQRSQGPANQALSALRQAARKETVNLVPLILEAVKCEVSLGEISDAFRDIWGEYQEQVVL